MGAINRPLQLFRLFLLSPRFGRCLELDPNPNLYSYVGFLLSPRFRSSTGAAYFTGMKRYTARRAVLIPPGGVCHRVLLLSSSRFVYTSIVRVQATSLHHS